MKTRTITVRGGPGCLFRRVAGGVRCGGRKARQARRLRHLREVLRQRGRRHPGGRNPPRRAGHLGRRVRRGVGFVHARRGRGELADEVLRLRHPATARARRVLHHPTGKLRRPGVGDPDVGGGYVVAGGTIGCGSHGVCRRCRAWPAPWWRSSAWASGRAAARNLASSSSFPGLACTVTIRSLLNLGRRAGCIVAGLSRPGPDGAAYPWMRSRGLDWPARRTQKGLGRCHTRLQRGGWVGNGGPLAGARHCWWRG